MKTSNLKNIMIAVIAIFLIGITSNHVIAQKYLTVYMDSVSELDTIYSCNTYDSIKFIPNNGIIQDLMWIVCEFYHPFDFECDTIYPDTLYLQSGFSGLIGCQGRNGVNLLSTWTNIKKLALTGEDKSATCSGPVQLIVYTNYSGAGNISFTWTPETGLSDPGIQNPIATIDGDREYEVTLNAPNGCVISKSISVTLQPVNPQPVCLVSVDSTNKNVIYWEKPETASVDSFFVYKETNVTDVYQIIGTVSYNDNSFFTDTASNAQIQSNKYEISVTDSCGTESVRSAPHKTMHLTLNQGLNNVWNLIWEPYIGIPVSTYYIYRGSKLTNLELIGTTSGSNTQYSDLTAPAGEIHYQIEIVSPGTCVISDNGSELKSTAITVNTSRSNMVSFNPTGLNEDENSSLIFSVYPNPANDVLFVKLNQSIVTGGSIEINNIEGRIIRRYPLVSSETRLDISDLETGFYLISIKTDKGSTIGKFTRE